MGTERTVESEVDDLRFCAVGSARQLQRAQASCRRLNSGGHACNCVVCAIKPVSNAKQKQRQT